jgi:ubiquinone biosynthesis protein
VLELAHLSPAVSIRDAAREVEGWLLQELDMQRELANLSRLHRLSRDTSLITVPRPYPALSGDRVLTSERIEGVALSDLVRAVRSRDAGAIERLAPAGLDLHALAERLILATFTQIFDFRFFHADLHPGNLFALPGASIGYVDFGLCDELDEKLRERQARYLAYLYAGDVDGMYVALSELLEQTPAADLPAFHEGFVAASRELLLRIAREDEKSPAGSDGEGRSPVSEWLVDVLGAARTHGLRLPPRLLSMYRALLTAEAVARSLAPDVDLRHAGRAFFRELGIRETLPELSREELRGLGASLASLLRTGPEQVLDLLTGLEEGTFGVGVGVSQTPAARRARRRRVALIGSAVLSIGPAALVAEGGLPAGLAWPLWALIVLLAIAIARDALRTR